MTHGTCVRHHARLSCYVLCCCVANIVCVHSPTHLTIDDASLWLASCMLCIVSCLRSILRDICVYLYTWIFTHPAMQSCKQARRPLEQDILLHESYLTNPTHQSPSFATSYATRYTVMARAVHDGKRLQQARCLDLHTHMLHKHIAIHTLGANYTCVTRTCIQWYIQCCCVLSTRLLNTCDWFVYAHLFSINCVWFCDSVLYTCILMHSSNFPSIYMCIYMYI